jgi:predicted molibdopterin-dependent oxidoreductase YjgC
VSMQVRLTEPLVRVNGELRHGHLCVKGRFGFEFVQRRARE